MSEKKLIAADTVVSIQYTLTGDDGTVIDSSEGGEPLTYLHGHGQLIPGLEQELEGKGLGDAVAVRIDAENGYGEHDPDRLVEVPRDRFEFDISEGDFVQAQQQDGTTVPFQVVGVEETTVTLDGNHPLAGKVLNFKVEVVGVRTATSEEIDHGHAH
ncbi:MAG: peptidylprolyl isomerase [Acidobacteria bacterium]|jgi:FKBP-type peptidyl-prolyl cis-trans isomerase SlyD|nr:peptidylprolyl isomerase [Acidobacteriota bacterium]